MHFAAVQNLLLSQGDQFLKVHMQISLDLVPFLHYDDINLCMFFWARPRHACLEMALKGQSMIIQSGCYISADPPTLSERVRQ